MTHVGVMTGDDDTNSGLVIFHDSETKTTTQHVLPHGEGRKPKLVNSVIERNYLGFRRRLGYRGLLLRQRIEGHEATRPKKTHEHTGGALGIGAIASQISIAIKDQLQQIRRVTDPPVEIQIKSRIVTFTVMANCIIIFTILIRFRYDFKDPSGYDFDTILIWFTIWIRFGYDFDTILTRF